jgi:parallel beta-helix repeat protein
LLAKIKNKLYAIAAKIFYFQIIYIMKNKLSSIFVLIAGLAVIAATLLIATPTAVTAQASGTTYYVSLTGNDSHPGTTTQNPLRTIARATYLAKPGDTIKLLSGTYNERLNATKSGTADKYITYAAEAGHKVMIDMRGSAADNIKVSGSYINIKGFELVNSSAMCGDITGSYINLSELNIRYCQGHGLNLRGKFIELRDSSVRATNLSNQDRSGPWGSAVKVQVGGENITIKNNTIYNNYGEGIAVTRGNNVNIVNNTVYDNYGVNIYFDNSMNIVADGNFNYCNPNSGFERGGNSATGFAIGEEYYSGWGARSNNITIKNNIVAFCHRAFLQFAPEVAGGGLSNVKILNNTFWKSGNTAISFSSEVKPGTTNQVGNNIVQQDSGKVIWMPANNGISFFNNLWSGTSSVPSYARGSGDKYGSISFIVTPERYSYNFRLKNTSQAIGAANKSVDITTDFESKSRDLAPDIGAIEYTTPETTVPTVAITEPVADAQPFLGSTLKIVANAQDASGIAKVVFFVNGTPRCASYTSATSFWCVYTVEQGVDNRNDIKVEVTDTYGNVNSATVSFTYILPDTTAPVITYVNPTEGQQLTPGINTKITVNTQDDSAIKKVIFFVNGTPRCASYTAATSYWCGYTVEQTADFRTVIKVEVTDLYGNVGSSTLIATHTGVETAPPVITFVSPTANQQLILGANIRITINTQDASPIKKVLFIVNGTARCASYTAATSYWCGYTVEPTADRSTVIRVEVTDAYGNVGVNTISPTYAADTIAPVITFVAPTDGQQLALGTTARITINTQDESPIKKVVFSVNGTPRCASYTAATSYWCAYTVEASPSNTSIIKVDVTDQQGNLGSSTVTITH